MEKHDMNKKTVTVETMELPYNPVYIFDMSTSRNWVASVEYNVIFLRSIQNYCNDLYQKRGYLFLNDVLAQLDLPISGAGQVLGWIFGESEGVLLEWTPIDDGAFEIIINPMGIIIDHIDELRVA